MNAEIALRMLGVGSAGALELGCASAVVEVGGAPLLLVDCGWDSLARYERAYGQPVPPAVFVTHCHMDHVAGLEGLFYRVVVPASGPAPAPVRLYVPVRIVPTLHARLAQYPSPLAEGGVNFWDAFQIIPVSDAFWHADPRHGPIRFSVFEARHHGPGSAYGLALPGAFAYTGDTRPIPETLREVTEGTELVFHDCRPRGNPSHSGLDDLEREYRPADRARMVLYHYATPGEAQQMAAAGYRVAHPGERFVLAGPRPQPTATGPRLAAG
ncbi:MAG: MBL fold metallo-hydrolase [Ectothiorhodospiraceae bacterium]|nr:MBL fold metallo-hydrolase [Ectothiorhodospiraceae bacterium]